VSPKKKPAAKKETKKTEKKKQNKQPAIKLPSPKKKKSNNPSPKKRKANDDSDDDDEPLVKKAKDEPNEAELKKVVSNILQGADLEQITMKTVVKQVINHTFFDPRAAAVKLIYTTAG